MILNILYILATSSLLIGSALTFDPDELADYFYLVGTSLFFLKASVVLIYSLKNQKNTRSYYDIIN